MDQEEQTSFEMIPVSSIKKRIQTIPDMEPENYGYYWVNWWITMGVHSYSSQHRNALQKKWNCIN